MERDGRTDLTIDAALVEVMCDLRSWVPEKMVVSEVAANVSETGIEMVAAVRSRMTATSTNRYLLQLKPNV